MNDESGMATKASSSSVFGFAGGFRHFRLPSLPLIVHVKENKPVIKLQQVRGLDITVTGCTW